LSSLDHCSSHQQPGSAGIATNQPDQREDVRRNVKPLDED
jgi:hypothetical protein